MRMPVKDWQLRQLGGCWSADSSSKFSRKPIKTSSHRSLQSWLMGDWASSAFEEVAKSAFQLPIYEFQQRDCGLYSWSLAFLGFGVLRYKINKKPGSMTMWLITTLTKLAATSAVTHSSFLLSARLLVR